jgi:hypothetical protein
VDFCVTAEHVAEQLQAAADAFFTDDEVKVVVDAKLSSKAAASAKRIRVRGGTCFSPMDLGQLRKPLISTIASIRISSCST